MATLEIEPFYDSETCTLAYLVRDRATRDAVVIDPVLDFDPGSGKLALDSVSKIVRRIRELGLALHYVLETHAHADHLSASQHLRNQLGARVAIGERIREVQATFKPILNLPEDFATDGSQFDRLLHDGEIVRAGALAFEVIATPGHTPACVSYRIDDAIFTGDALFVEDYGTGRCDFPHGDAETLYRSVHERLYALPGETRVFVGHDYRPDGRELRWSSTIAIERERNIQLDAKTSLAEFVAFRRARDRTLAAPRLLFPSVQVNIDAGRLPPVEASGRRYLRIPLDLSAMETR
jgi:glyoxylase-like metal-dependent hydrolase (beta-lactamase superfamily II)